MPQRDSTYSDYKKVHDIIVRYREYGSQDELTRLVLMLYPIIRSYTEMYNGRYNGNGDSVLRFIKYFDKRTLPHTIKRKSCKDDRYIKRVRGFRLFKAATCGMSYDDYYGELLQTVAKLIHRYRVGEHPNFIPFVNSYFHFVLLESLKKTFRNMSINYNLSEDNGYDYEEYLYESRSFEKSHEFLNYNVCSAMTGKKVDCYSDSMLGATWIKGHKMSRFLCLTPGVRALLVDHYIRKHTYHEIARNYGVSRNTIARIFIKAKATLSDKGIW